MKAIITFAIVMTMASCSFGTCGTKTIDSTSIDTIKVDSLDSIPVVDSVTKVDSSTLK